MSCKTWTLPAEYFQGLCNMQFHPVVGQPSCPVCVVAEREPPVQCASECDPLLLANRYIILNLESTLTDPGYAYPFNVVKPGTDYAVYDKIPSASQIGTPGVLAATSWVDGVNLHCTWEYTEKTTRWYRRRDNSDGSRSMEIIDSPYGTSIANPFDDCVETGDYPRYFCRSQDWGFTYRLSITSSGAQLNVFRFVARHLIADGVTPLLPGTSDGADSFFPNWVHLIAGSLPASSSGFIWAPYDNGAIATWTLANPCSAVGDWVFTKTHDSHDRAQVPGGILFPSGATYPARDWISPAGFPSTVRLSVRR